MTLRCDQRDAADHACGRLIEGRAISRHTEPVRTRATFRLFGNDPDLTADAVTRKLGIEPTMSGEAGTHAGQRSSAIRKMALWTLSASREIESGVELAVQLDRLLAVLEPRAAALWELTGAGYEANWHCWVESHAAEHAVEIDRQLMTRLLALPGDLWLDVCGDNEEE
jgi:hypothetical protein